MDQPESRPSARFVELSPRQQTAVAVALTIIATAVILAAILGLGWLIAGFLKRFSSVFLPIAVGGVAALVFRPYYHWLRQKLRLPVPLALVTVLLSILLPLIAFGWFFGALGVEQISDMAHRLPAWWDKVQDQARERWPRIREFFENNVWGQRIRDMAEGQKEAVVHGLQAFGGRALSAGAGVVGWIGALAAWAVLPVYFVFFLVAGSSDRKDRGDERVAVEEWLPFLKKETREDVSYLINEFISLVVGFFRGQLIIAFLQGLLFAIGFSLVGLRYGFVLGLLLGFLNIIPYLGSMIGLGIGLPLAYFQQGGGWMLIGLVLVVFTIVQLIESYALTPKIMGDRTGLHPVAIIVAIFFWGSALQGILGMILAIPLTAFLVVFWRLAREKYIGELV